MTSRDMSSMRAQGHSTSTMVTATASFLRDKVLYRTGVTSATDTTITNKDLVIVVSVAEVTPVRNSTLSRKNEAVAVTIVDVL